MEAIITQGGFTWSIRPESGYKGLIHDKIGADTSREPKRKEYLNGHIKRKRMFIDIGAHTGNFAIPYSKVFREVVAFEPNPFNFAGLARNAFLNGIKNITQLNLAVGSSLETIYMTWAGGGTKPERMRTNDTELKVQSVPLDIFEFTPDAIKIDTEGFEEYVLAGARKTIMKYRPVLLIECHEKTHHIKDQTKRIKFILTKMKYNYTIVSKSLFGDANLCAISEL